MRYPALAVQALGADRTAARNIPELPDIESPEPKAKANAKAKAKAKGKAKAKAQAKAKGPAPASAFTWKGALPVAEALRALPKGQVPSEPFAHEASADRGTGMASFPNVSPSVRETAQNASQAPLCNV